MSLNESPALLVTRPWGRDDYLRWFEAFLSESNMPATVFGWEALKNPNFMRKLRGTENDVELGTLEKAVAFAVKHMAEMEAQSL